MQVPIVIVGTKYDVLQQNESEKLKWICRALRYFAHINGADLVFTQMKEKGFSDFKQIMSTHTYSESKIPKLQFEHGKPISVIAATDKLTKIGDP